MNRTDPREAECFKGVVQPSCSSVKLHPSSVIHASCGACESSALMSPVRTHVSVAKVQRSPNGRPRRPEFPRYTLLGRIAPK